MYDGGQMDREQRLEPVDAVYLLQIDNLHNHSGHDDWQLGEAEEGDACEGQILPSSIIHLQMSK